MIYEFNLEQETRQFGEELGEKAKAGDIYCLVGDLGAGKTILSKGIATGLKVFEEVSSPTFTILNLHNGRLVLNHFDVYRIENQTDMEDLGFNDIIYGDGVSVIEWADKIKEIIPAHAIWITIERDLEKGEAYRKITVEEGRK